MSDPFNEVEALCDEHGAEAIIKAARQYSSIAALNLPNIGRPLKTPESWAHWQSREWPSVEACARDYLETVKGVRVHNYQSVDSEAARLRSYLKNPRALHNAFAGYAASEKKR